MKPSASLSRFSLSMPADLACQLDAMVKAKGYANRSQAVAELVRSRLVECAAEAGDQVIAGTITLVYDHHKHNIQGLLTDIQHDHAAVLIATLVCGLNGSGFTSRALRAEQNSIARLSRRRVARRRRVSSSLRPGPF